MTMQPIVAVLIAFAWVLVCLPDGSSAGNPVKLIIDTDAGFDVDDVGAICIANALQDNGEAEIIAISHTNGFVEGIGAVSTLMHFYNRDQVPLGAYKGVWADKPSYPNGNQIKYVPDLVDHFPSPIKSSVQTPNATSIYRKVLAAQPDHSVHIASIGITTNMRDLVLSQPDEFSPLNGTELIAQKVNLVVWMDGAYNFGCAQYSTYDWLGPDTGCRGSAQAAVMNWPSSVKQIFSGVGADTSHGSWLTGCAGYGNPCRQAFEDWLGPNKGRSAWDPITVMIAVRGAENINCKEVDQGGHNVVNVDGSETWVPGNSSNQTRIAYAGDNPQEAISFKLNELLCQPPGHWSNNTWNMASGANCYGPRGDQPAHGATDLEHPPTASCGEMPLNDCFTRCLELPGCTGVTVQPASGGNISCYRKADVSLEHCDVGTKFTTYQRREWTFAGGFNCYDGHGGKDLENPPSSSCGTMTVRECQTKCEDLPGCSAIVWEGADHSGVGACYRKADIVLGKCDRGTGFDLYMAAKPF